MIQANILLKLATYYYKIITKKAFDSTFNYLLSSFLGMQISSEDFKAWFNKNNSILSDKSNYSWSIIDDDRKYLIGRSDNYLNNTVICISRDNKIPLDFSNNESEQDITLNYGKIPNLYVFTIGDAIAPDTKFSKLLSENFFITISLAKIFHKVNLNFDIESTLTQNNIDSITNFINDNLHKINKIRHSFEYTPKLLGAGLEGVAFDINTRMVLKIFKDKFTYSKALESLDRLHEGALMAKSEAMIYDLGMFTKYNDQDVFYIILEKMKTLDSLKSSDAMFDIGDDAISNKIYKVLVKVVDMSNSYKDKIDLLKETEKNIVKSKSNLKHLKDYYKAIKSSNPEYNIDYARAQLQDDIERFEYDISSNIELMSNEINNSLLKDDISSVLVEIKESVPNLEENWIKLFIQEILFKSITQRGDLQVNNIGLSVNQLSNKSKFMFYDPSNELYKDTINTAW